MTAKLRKCFLTTEDTEGTEETLKLESAALFLLYLDSWVSKLVVFLSMQLVVKSVQARARSTFSLRI